MARKQAAATLPIKPREPTLVERVRALRLSINEAQQRYWNRAERKAAEQMVSQLGRFEALLDLWRKGC